MMQEEWRDIPGFPNYQISNLGRIFSKPRLRAKCGFLKFVPNTKRGGYLNVTLYRNGRGHRLPVHQLAALVFLGPRPPGPEAAEIRHLDGDVTNNAACNLAYGSHRENGLDVVSHGRHNQASKTHCPQAHPYDKTNTYVIPSTGGRLCRICQRSRTRKAAA